MADGVRKVEALPDPVGEVLGMTKRPNGLVIGKNAVVGACTLVNRNVPDGATVVGIPGKIIKQ